MDESRNKILKEAYINSFKKNELNHSNKIGKQTEPKGEHIHTFKGGHKLYHHENPDILGQSTFSVHGPDGTKHAHLTTRRNHAGTHYVGLAASSGQGPKMHDVYHHLLKSGRVKTLVGDNSQSHGAVKVWQRLNRKKDVNIHGWDEDDEKPVNLGKRFDPDETHTQNKGIYKIYKDRQNSPSEKDRKKYSQAMDDHEKQSRMRLVAHLKEAMVNNIRKKPVDEPSEYGTGTKVKPEGEHIHTFKGGYTLHHTIHTSDWNEKKIHHFTVHGPDGTKHIHLNTSHGSRPKDVNNAHHVEWAESSGKGPKMHDVYHHLLKSGRVKALESKNQSPGAIKVWQRLNRKKDVHIHGWNWDKSKPVNFGKRFDPDETHSRPNDANKLDADKLDTMKKHGRDHKDIQKYNDESNDNYDKIRTSMIAHLKEAVLNSIVKNASEFSENGVGIVSQPEGEHIHTFKGGHKLYHYKDRPFHRFSVHGPDGTKQVHLSTKANDAGTHYVDWAESSGHGPKMHDVYHHLLKSGHVKILQSKNQSRGAVKVWQRLNRKKDVNIHGWDPETEKPVNTGKRFDPDETHIKWSDSEKLHTDHMDTQQKHGYYHKDTKKYDNEAYGHGETRRMNMIAHLKEVAVNQIQKGDSTPHLFGDAKGDHIGTLKGGYKIYHEKPNEHDDDYHVFHVKGPDGLKHVRLSTRSKDGKNHEVSMAASSGKGPKMHDVYHHLLKSGHIHTLSTDNQSPGAVKTWQRLNRKKSVNIHGWDPETEKPVNLGKRFDTDDTHVHHNDVEKTKADRQVWYDKLEDEDAAHAELYHTLSKRKMKLVAHLKEVLDLDDVGKDEKFGHKIGHKVSENDGPIGKKISSFKGHDVHHHVNPKGHHVYSVVDPKTQTKHVQLTGYPSDKHKGLEIGTLVSTGKGPKAHELYHHMLKQGHVSHLTTDSQSEGGRKVWEKLNRKRDVHIHGWDTDNEKPVNLGKRFDHEETHSSFRGYTKLTADRAAASKRKSEIEVGLKGGKFNRRHLARAKKDLDHANDEIQHAATRERMQLVAHLREAILNGIEKDDNTDIGIGKKDIRGKHISTMPSGHKVYRETNKDFPSGKIYHVHDKDGVRHFRVGTTKLDSGTHMIGLASSSGKGPKLHDVYHHLLKTGEAKAFESDDQSPGAIKGWQRLHRKKDVNVHGWDHQEQKAVNLGRIFDPQETHRTHRDIDNARRDHNDMQKHGSERDMAAAAKELNHARKTQSMSLVAHLKEVKSIDLGKEHKFGARWDEKPDSFAHGEKISSFKGHDVYRKNTTLGRSYTVFDKDGNKHIQMGGFDRSGGLKIDTVASSSKGPKVHDFYHHLLKKGHEKHLVANEQSEGGKKVWQNLNRKRSVNIHGWNPHTQKPVNLGKHFDPDETHRTSDEVHKAGDEYSDRKWHDYHLKKKDTRRARKDYRDESNIRDMHLVAHLKEDAPGNAVGGGHVAGLGVGPMGEPGVHHRRGKFGKYDTFLVSPNTFLKARSEKKKGAHWRKYLEEDEQYNVIREYAFKQPKKPIILQCERTGAMCFARYGLR